MALSLPVSLWTLLDNYFASLLSTWCAKYTELAGVQIQVGEQYDPNNVSFPFVLIYSYERKWEEAEPRFGDGKYHIDGLYYPYEFIIAHCFETLAEAKNFACNASASLTVELAENIEGIGELIGADGEGVKLFEYDDGELSIRGLAGQQPEGKYSGSAVVRIRVLTER